MPRHPITPPAARVHVLVTVAALLGALAPTAHAQSERAVHPVPHPGADKGQYHLFNPTPRDLWRPLSPDRPDFTESPYTVDAGAMQLELSWVDWTSRSGASAWSIAPANLKLGLFNTVDFQFEIAPFVREGSGSTAIEGFGGTEFRVKWNLWGDDGGATALAVMPFIAPPTSSGGVGSSHVEGGIIVPFALEIADGLGMGAMFETAFVYDAVRRGYDTEFILSAVLDTDITDVLGVYAEGIGIFSTDTAAEAQALLGLGITVLLTENLMLDVGMTVGLAGGADEIGLFTGLTVRF